MTNAAEGSLGREDGVMKKVVGAGITIGMACAAMVLFGCVTDFKDGGEDFANGCKRGDGEDRAELGISVTGGPFCATVSNNTKVGMRRDSTLSACRLRGGTSDGTTGVLDSENWIEVKTEQKGTLLEAGALFDVATDGGAAVIPFYCEEDAGLAGAIFVDP